jgi:hypothetical protein
MNNLFGKSLSLDLKSKSLKALNCFNKVLEDLRDVNKKSLEEQKKLSETIESIAIEIDDLKSIELSNEKIIQNIESILK